MLGSTKGNICQLNPKSAKISKKKQKKNQSKQTNNNNNNKRKGFTINKHSGMPYVITGINFICLEHSMAGSYKED